MPRGVCSLEIEAVGDKLFLQRDFTDIDGQSRNGVGVISLSAGEVLDFNPDPDDGEFYHMSAINDRIYLSGEFTSVSGSARNSVAAFDTESFALTGFDLGKSSYLYAAASFLSYKGLLFHYYR